MDAIVATMLYLATAPIMLMPASIVLFGRRQNAGPIVAINLTGWIALYFLIASNTWLSVPVILVGWLLLLRSATRSKPATSASAPADS